MLQTITLICSLQLSNFWCAFTDQMRDCLEYKQLLGIETFLPIALKFSLNLTLYTSYLEVPVAMIHQR